MSPNKVISEKSRSFVNRKTLRSNNKKKQHSPTDQGATISKLVSECNTKHVTSPRMLTHKFLGLIIEELKGIADKEKSQSKIGVINQISFDLRDFLTELDSNRPADAENENARNSNVILKQALAELRRLDHASMSQRMALYERVEMSTNFNLDFPNIGSEPVEMNNLELHMGAGPSSKLSINSTQYFDKSVLSGAALEAHLQSKNESDIAVNIVDVNINKFSDHIVTQLKLCGDVLIGVCDNGSIVKFSFRGSVLPHLPHRTTVFNVCQGPVAEMIMWNNLLLLATKEGSVIKCNSRYKVLSSFPFNEEVTGMTELKGLLYVTTRLRKIHVINVRSLTRFKEPVELGHVVKVIRSAMYKGSPVIVCLTENGDMVGLFINDGSVGSPAFKYKSGATLFDVAVSDDSTSSVTFYCGGLENVTCQNLIDNSVSLGVLARASISAMTSHDQFLFVGSESGDVLMINIASKCTYCYSKVVDGKIISLAYQPCVLYIGSESGVSCLCIENMDEINLPH